MLRLATSRPAISAAARWSRAGALCQGPAGRNEVSLTFDDGPDPRCTPAILSALAAVGAQATFFFVGAAAAKHPDIVRAAAAAGHEVGTHLWNHDRGTVNDDAAFEAELIRSKELLSDLACRPVQHLRFPYGDAGRQRLSSLARYGVTAVHWTVSGHDTRARDGTEIVRRLAATVRPGAIVLLHDGIADEAGRHPPYRPSRDATARVLPEILALLRNRGLRAVTVARLIRSSEPQTAVPAS